MLNTMHAQPAQIKPLASPAFKREKERSVVSGRSDLFEHEPYYLVRLGKRKTCLSAAADARNCDERAVTVTLRPQLQGFFRPSTQRIRSEHELWREPCL